MCGVCCMSCACDVYGVNGVMCMLCGMLCAQRVCVCGVMCCDVHVVCALHGVCVFVQQDTVLVTLDHGIPRDVWIALQIDKRQHHHHPLSLSLSLYIYIYSD